MDSPVTNSVWIGIHHAHAGPCGVHTRLSPEKVRLTSKERSKGSQSDFFFFRERSISADSVTRFFSFVFFSFGLRVHRR